MPFLQNIYKEANGINNNLQFSPPKAPNDITRDYNLSNLKEFEYFYSQLCTAFH